MPLGASRVEGFSPFYESYRHDLWKLLVSDGREFDLVGTNSDPNTYPSFKGESFDQDHQGFGGITSTQILNQIDNWMTWSGQPDLVLFSSPGGNDALQGQSYSTIVSNINQIIDIIQENNPKVTIVLESPAPARKDVMTGQIASYFTTMQKDVHEIAKNQSNSKSQVIVVDMATGFDESFFADEVHYNEQGAEFVANKYYELLAGLLEE